MRRIRTGAERSQSTLETPGQTHLDNGASCKACAGASYSRLGFWVSLWGLSRGCKACAGASYSRRGPGCPICCKACARASYSRPGQAPIALVCPIAVVKPARGPRTRDSFDLRSPRCNVPSCKACAGASYSRQALHRGIVSVMTNGNARAGASYSRQSQELDFKQSPTGRCKPARGPRTRD